MSMLQEFHFQAAQKGFRCEARDRSTSGGVLNSVRWSEAIKRNEADEAFSAACNEGRENSLWP
jgi:hypothetical protein